MRGFSACLLVTLCCVAALLPARRLSVLPKPVAKVRTTISSRFPHNSGLMPVTVGKVLKKKKSVSNLADPKMESPRTRKVKATGTKTPSALPLVPPLSMRTPTKPSEGKAGAGAARSAEALVASPLPAAAKSTPGAGRAAGASSNPSGGAGGAGRPSVSFSITVDRPDAASTAKELGIDFDLDSFNRKRAKRSVAETEVPDPRLLCEVLTLLVSCPAGTG